MCPVLCNTYCCEVLCIIKPKRNTSVTRIQQPTSSSPPGRKTRRDRDPSTGNSIPSRKNRTGPPGTDAWPRSSNSGRVRTARRLRIVLGAPVRMRMEIFRRSRHYCVQTQIACCVWIDGLVFLFSSSLTRFHVLTMYSSTDRVLVGRMSFILREEDSVWAVDDTHPHVWYHIIHTSCWKDCRYFPRSIHRTYIFMSPRHAAVLRIYDLLRVVST